MRVIRKDHNKLFEDCQNRYLENRSKETLSEMYLILTDYYCNLFINYAHKKCLIWSDEEIREKACDASSRIIERFIRNPDFKIELRLSAYADYDKIYVLYHDKDYEMNRYSLEALTDSVQGHEEKEQKK